MLNELRVAVVCSSNQNRSMEAHAFLSKKGFKVRSFGSGNQVKLPGPAPDKPNVYDFSISYEQMYQDLLSKDKALIRCRGCHLEEETSRHILCDCEVYSAQRFEHLGQHIVNAWELQDVPVRYTQNGLLHMLDRNRRIKSHPERFQQCYDTFDVIFTVEERVYDQVVEELANRPQKEIAVVHIVNIDVQDNHEEATIGAFLICEMATMMAESEDLDNDIDELLQEFEAKAQRPILHTIRFY